MGLFDNMKSRLGFGNQGYDDYDEYERSDGAYADEYYQGGRADSGGRGYSGTGGYDEYYDSPVPMRSFGVDRADYYNDNHAPLVTRADVRSQPLPLSASAGRYQSEARYQDDRHAESTSRQSQRFSYDESPSEYDQEDALAFKNGLARTPNSLTQLHTERLRLEDSGKIVAIRADQVGTLTSAHAMQHRLPDSYDRSTTGYAGQVRQQEVSTQDHYYSPAGQVRQREGAAGAGQVRQREGAAGAGQVRQREGAAGAGQVRQREGAGGAGPVRQRDPYAPPRQRESISQARARETAGVAGDARQRTARRIEVLIPTTYADAEQITNELKKGSVVILDLRSTRPDLAKRILDFSFGAASALEGQVERHVDRVYIFYCTTPLTESEKLAIRI